MWVLLAKLGGDSFGDFIENKFKRKGVDISQLYRTKKVNTTLAFVSLTEDGDRDFIFYRNPGADELLTSEEIDRNYIKEASLFHFGSLSLSNDKSRKATTVAVKHANKSNLIVTMDPNIRLNLWEDKSRLKKLALKFLKYVDIAKLNREEMKFFTREKNLKKGTRKINNFGPILTIVTLGEDGCFLNYQGNYQKISGHKIEVKDTTGAGDGFMAGFIYKLFKQGSKFPNISLKKVIKAVKFGNAAGALSATDFGAISSFPDKKSIKNLLESE